MRLGEKAEDVCLSNMLCWLNECWCLQNVFLLLNLADRCRTNSNRVYVPPYWTHIEYVRCDWTLNMLLYRHLIDQRNHLREEHRETLLTETFPPYRHRYEKSRATWPQFELIWYSGHYSEKWQYSICIVLYRISEQLPFHNGNHPSFPILPQPNFSHGIQRPRPSLSVIILNLTRSICCGSQNIYPDSWSPGNPVSSGRN